MEDDDPRKDLEEALWKLPDADREAVSKAVEGMLRQTQGAQLPPEVITRMIPDEIKRLVTERNKVGERIDCAMSRGNHPSPHDWGAWSLYHQQLSYWRNLRDTLERGVEPRTALGEVRKAAYRAVLSRASHVGTPFPRAHAEVGKQAAAFFLAQTDGEEDE